MVRRAETRLPGILSAKHWYAEDKFNRGIISYGTGLPSSYKTDLSKVVIT